MARLCKLSLIERALISPGICRTTYESNIKIKEFSDIGQLKKTCLETMLPYFGIDPDERPDDLQLEVTVNRKSELGVLVPEGTYTFVLLDSGSITRLPETVQVAVG